MFLQQQISGIKIVVLACILLCFACNTKKEDTENEEKALAIVYGKKLYPSELKNIVPNDVPAKDSLALIKNYIDKWVQEELLLHYAEQNLSTEQLNIDKQIEEYRKNLIIYTYQTELIRQQLDTIVSAVEIEKYYNEHLSDFMLKDNIIKVHYVKVSKKAPNLDKVRKWYISVNPKDIEALRSYCIQFAENFFIDDNTWLLFDDLLKEVPLGDYNPELFLKSNKAIEVNDSLSTYFINITGYKIKDNASPLSFEKENIRNIIINKRKLKLVDDMKKQVYADELEKKNFEVY